MSQISLVNDLYNSLLVLRKYAMSHNKLTCSHHHD